MATDDFSPAELTTLPSGDHCLAFDTDQFDDDFDVVDAFASAELEGSGADWVAVLAPALEAHDDVAFAAIQWVPEPDTFRATSADKRHLRVLANVIREVTQDEAHLLEAIAAYDPDRTKHVVNARRRRN